MRSLKVITYAALAMTAMSAQLAMSQSSSSPEPTEAGKAIYKRANCFGCHKWHGDGGGGYGGAALSLRATQLKRHQRKESVPFGRPGTAKPFLTRRAHDSNNRPGNDRQEVGDP